MIQKGIAYCLIVLYSCLILPGLGYGPGSDIAVNPAVHAAGLFESDDVLQIKLTGNLKELLNDRGSTVPRLFPFRFSYTSEQGTETVMPVEVRTRGHFRRMRENCTYPPLLIKFPDEGPHLSSVFSAQKKLKLVMPCAGEEYIIREWLVYKAYNLVTPKSLKARLVKIQLVDERSTKIVNPVFGLLLEEEDQMAKRNNATGVETKIRPQQTERSSFLTMAVFQYLVGNTDWSVEFLQNIKLITADPAGSPMTVAYDFDHAGIVNAPYAHPAEELQMSSVRERRYRGYCINDLSLFNPVLGEFTRLKSDIYKLYTDCKLLDEKYRKSTLRYLDEFYTTISNIKSWQNEFAYPCDRNGTGNVIIKGLKEE